MQTESEPTLPYQLAYESLKNPAVAFFAVDTQGYLREINDTYAKLTGYSRETLLCMHIRQLDVHDSDADIQQRMNDLRHNGFANFRTEHQHQSGLRIPLEIIVTFTEKLGGYFLAFARDISEKLVQERQLALTSHAFSAMSQAICICDASNTIIAVNPALCQITGYSEAELIGKTPRLFSSGRHDKAFYQTLWQSLFTHDFWEGEIWDKRKNGTIYPKWMRISVIRNDSGAITQFFSIFTDISERKQIEEIVWRQANFDALTALPNRAHFQSQVQLKIKEAQRNNSKFAIIYLDIDSFKDINDTLGHRAGDKLLIQIAERLKEQTRNSDLIARSGGDEFTLLLSSYLKPEQIGSFIETLLNELRSPFYIDKNEVRMSASIGIALYPDDGTTQDDLCKNADIAMYQAKSRGKNNFQFFHQAMNNLAINRLALIHQLHTAVSQQQFTLFYQPKIALNGHALVGMEALVRWPKSDGSMVSPLNFIPCAEETGLIIPMGKWILQEACRQTQAWNQQFGCNLKVAVNLSPRQFRSNDVVSVVLNTLKETQLPATNLELEITEGVLMDDVESSIQSLKELRSHGISVAIDDFGTGYSSLNYLRKLPITTLKIDQSFVADLLDNDDGETLNSAIIDTILTLAHSLKLAVVAEGVENQQQLQYLRQVDCDMVQGYFLSRPLATEQFTRYLESYPSQP
ncbi:MAG: EAL domain-containing protein [Gammaproteobacteria bacterium]|nr:EAL domain-containing protein [Gammaproteobacteria bacterium]